MADPLGILSLCSGVGWLDEGVRAALGHLGRASRVLGYCERDAAAAATLLARMEDASLAAEPVWCGNLQDMDCGEFAARPGFRGCELLVAGFPCQPWSSAGKQAGTNDARWLWPAIAKIVDRLQPPLVFLENVPGLVSGRGLNHVLDGLAVRGFDAEWLDLKARSVGANHLRRRVFILAYRAGLGRPQAEPSAPAGRSDTQRRRRRLDDSERVGRRSRRHDHGIDERDELGSASRDAMGDAAGGRRRRPPQDRRVGAAIGSARRC